MSESVKIIEDGYLVTCDAQRTMGFFSILIKEERIAEISSRSDNFKVRFPNAEIIDASEKILFPGFVDAHYHGESFALRHWTSDVPMARWTKEPNVRAALDYVHHRASKDELVPMYRSAYFAALKSGITFLSEFCFDNEERPFLAAREAMKRSDLKGFVAAHNGEQIDEARTAPGGPGRVGLVLPGEDELTTYNLQSTLRLATDIHWPIVSHLGETRKGVETLKRNFHRSAARILDEYRLLSQSLHLVHCACLEVGDEEVLGRAPVPIIVNAASVLTKGGEIPPLGALLAAGASVALCSDWGLPDPFENMRALQHLLRQSGLGAIDSHDILGAHTIQSARALGVHEEVGSVEPGKKADITFLDSSDLRLQFPLQQGTPASILTGVLAQAASYMVSDVMINGEFFLRKRQVMTYSEEDLKNEYRDFLERIASHSIPVPIVRESRNDSAPPMATILPLTPERRPEPSPPVAHDLMNEPFDEGFRIVGTGGTPPPSEEKEPETKEEEKEEGRELPKTVRRVFGEDDL